MSLLFVVILTLVLVQIFCVFMEFNYQRNNRLFFAFYGVLILFECVLEFRILSEREYIISKYMKMFIFVYAFIGLIVNLVILLRRYNKRKINDFSIKRTIDLSENGILIYDNDGAVLENAVMRNLLEKLDIHKDYDKMLLKISDEVLNNQYIVKVDDGVWLFENNKDNNEFMAYDITDEYNYKLELEEKNKEIEENNGKIAELIENMEIIEKQKQTQLLKNKFHDVLGQNISIIFRCMSKDLSNIDFDEIKFMIRKMFLEISDEKKNPKVCLNDLIRVYNNTDTKINLDGNLPESFESGNVFFEVIREAVTNAIKHANSTVVNVSICNDNGHNRMIITNNGLKPNGNFTENEGIRGMKRKVHEIGGEIFISAEDEFKIEVIK